MAERLHCPRRLGACCPGSTHSVHSERRRASPRPSPVLLPWLSGTSFPTVGGRLSPGAGIARALALGGGGGGGGCLGRCGPQAPHEKSPKWRELPVQTLAPQVSGRSLGLQATQSPRGWRSGTAVGKGRQEQRTEELGRGRRETEAGTARDLGGGAGESVQCPGTPRRSRRGAIEAQGPAECEKAGNPRAVWKARQAGKGGRGGGGAAWAATSKGPRGVPGQLAPLALLRAPD